jgi:nitroreductase
MPRANGQREIKVTEKKYDVGILGWWYGKNYGSIMTYYGLNRAITRLGYETLMVHEALGYNNWRVQWPDNILSMEFARRVGYKYTQQVHYSELPQLNDIVNTFVVGSDQLWNPRIGRVNDDLFLDFVAAENKRVAYATSFGNRDVDKFTPAFVAKQTENLKNFDAISVREEYAVDIAKSVFGVEAKLVVDPVFLLSADDYIALAEKATVKVKGDYLAVFFLDPTPEKKQVAESIARKLGLSKIVVIPNPDGGRSVAEKLFQGDSFEIISEDSPENFLHAYKDSRYVVTDSFHGTAFSIIFQKPFSSIYNSKRGADRFVNLLKALGFGEARRVRESDTAETINTNANVSFAIDFAKAIDHLSTGRKVSLNWLHTALSSNSSAARTEKNATVTSSARAPSNEAGQKKSAKLEKPHFVASNGAWRIETASNATRLSIAPAGAVRGNLVWCDLPFPLAKGAAYKVSVNWAVRTNGRAINLHIRDGVTGKFKVAGGVPVRKTKSAYIDAIDFVVTEDGYTQFMLGGIHFTGDNAGADISSILVEQIPVSNVSQKAPPRSPVEVAKDLALADNDRFVNSYAQNMRSRNIGNARALLMYHSHGIEKGLSRNNFRPGFGSIAIPALAIEMNKWVAAGSDTNDSFFQIAAAVMHAYFERHKKLDVDVSNFRDLFKAPVLDIIAKADAKQGGVLTAVAAREPVTENGEDRDFIDVVFGRRSVREFTSAFVADEDIQQAVRIAMQAPSVCNRQPVRVHQFADPKMIEGALEMQGGFRGYQSPPRLLLVTADLASFVAATERNQAYVDGGLFAMLLLLGLEQVGLGACPLNTMMSTEREDKARRILNIPASEVFITFIAAGHFEPSVLTPRSTRLPLEEVLIQHDQPSSFSRAKTAALKLVGRS